MDGPGSDSIGTHRCGHPAYVLSGFRAANNPRTSVCSWVACLVSASTVYGMFCRRYRGATLLEVVVTVVIALVLLTVGVAGYWQLFDAAPKHLTTSELRQYSSSILSLEDSRGWLPTHSSSPNLVQVVAELEPGVVWSANNVDWGSDNVSVARWSDTDRGRPNVEFLALAARSETDVCLAIASPLGKTQAEVRTATSRMSVCDANTVIEEGAAEW